MNVELVMIGTELLLGEVVDTNAQWLAGKLADIGVDVFYKSTVGDNWVRMTAAITQALTRSEVVITSGGLGPTQDDLTREVVAAATGRPLVKLEEAEQHIGTYFRQTGRQAPDSVWQQAYFPQGARTIPNQRGTALGFILEIGQKAIISLPGVPSELVAMVEETVLPYLKSRQGESVTRSRVLRFFGLGESAMEDLVRDLIEAQSNPTIAPYAGSGEARLRITARAASEREAFDLIAPLEAEVRRRGGRYIYGADETSLEQVVGDLLAARGETLATAESCTGGLLAGRITSIPGSSRYFMRGWVTYSNESKTAELGVAPELLAQYGAVSAQVAEAMAVGARAAAGCTYALSITGIAGPGGGTATKPVGLVYIGLAGPDSVSVQEFRFRGHREGIRIRAASSALNMLRLALESE